MVTLKEVEYGKFGKCLSISNGAMEIYVTVDIGPRIIKCNLNGCENLMFNDGDRTFSQDVSDAFGEGKTWYIYGGHRMWISPENLPLTYYPDNEKVLYTPITNGAAFKPSQQKVNDVQHEIEIVMDDEKPEIKLTHKLTNKGDKPFSGAIWALSVMDKNGVAIIPQPREDTGLLGNRVLALWAYTDMTDKRVFWGDKYIALKQIPGMERKFKLGINNTSGWVAYLNYGQALVKSYSPNHPDGTYPDFGVSTEVFTNHRFLEAETLSELCEIQPEQTITHVENWKLVGGVDKPLFTNESLEAVAEGL